MASTASVRQMDAPQFAQPQETANERGRDPIAALICAVAQGQHIAFARLYRLTAPRLLTLASGIMGQPSLGEDVLQEAFTRVWRYADRFDPARGSGLGWLASIVRNRALTLKAARRERAGLGDHNPAPEPASDAPDSFAVYAQGEDAGRVRACMSKLSEDHRHSLQLVYYEGLNHRELAERLNVPVGTAKSWVRRGLGQLGRCLRAAEPHDARELIAAGYALGSLQGPARAAFEQRRERDATYCIPAAAWEAALAELTYALPGMEEAVRRLWPRVAAATVA